MTTDELVSFRLIHASAHGAPGYVLSLRKAITSLCLPVPAQAESGPPSLSAALYDELALAVPLVVVCRTPNPGHSVVLPYVPLP